MKIFQLNTFCGIKSTGRIATDIALLLERQGHKCRIGYGAGHVPKELERFGFRIGFPLERKIHSAIRKLFDGEGYGSHLGTLALIRELKRFQPDVIHLHNIHGCYLNFRLLFRYIKKSEIPVVWTLHDCWPMTGHCAYFEYANCFRWQASCGQCVQQHQYPICIGLDGSRRNLRHKKKLFSGLKKLRWVTPCNWLQSYVDHSWLRMYPSQVIYNGIDLSVFSPKNGEILKEKYQITAAHILLAVAADWDERKGLRFLLEAAEKWDTEYQLVVLGLSNEQILALPHGILGIAATSDVGELAAWYSLADCLVNPTMEDNMPMVNLEALACGTPVVVFQTGGCPEAVDETCGMVVPQGDSDALAKAVLQIASRKPELVTACLNRAKIFDNQTCYAKYLELYKEFAL